MSRPNRPGVDRLDRHYWWRRRRDGMWSAHRMDLDRTIERIELGQRVVDALNAQNPRYLRPSDPRAERAARMRRAYAARRRK